VTVMMQSTDRRQPKIQERINRIMAKNRMAHAYLFEGAKGAGKKEMAAYFAQSLFCQSSKENEPCLNCTECTRIQNRNHPDVHWIEPEGASIKIEQVRNLQREFSYRGLETDRKVYIIDHIESMTPQAANSLLKFLEEPHPGTVALLLTEQRQRILPTILSRCQEMKFPPPSPTQMIEHLATQYGNSLAYLSSHITADLEEALSLCQSEWFAELRNLVIQLTEELTQPSSKAIFMVQDKWTVLAKDKEQTDIGLELLLLWYKDLLYLKLELTDNYIYIDQIERLSKQALYWSKERIARGIEAILSAMRRLHANVNSQLLLEQLVIRLQEG
jgi:DNA polymerase-3 subunit delta'